MTIPHPPAASRFRDPPACPAPADGPARGRVRDGLWGAALVVAGLLLVGVIAALDARTGPQVSFGIFYLIPLAACAWWGGFPHGILLALAGALAWGAVDAAERPLLALTVGVWNGVTRFGTFVLLSRLISRLRAGILREQLLARTDALTGAANGRTFYEAVAREADRARRAGRPLTLAYLDLDNFKLLNDRAGHAAGDAALVHAVETVALHLRGSDLLARLGGDEFALLLPETEAEGAAALLARLQAAVGQAMADRGWPVTLSAGAITFVRPAWDVDRMVQRVDALMYDAKRKGKGRVEHVVIPDSAGAGPGRGRERRATTRVRCGRPARVRPDGPAGAPAAVATVRDLSAAGVGLFLERPFDPGLMLLVEPLAAGPRPLLARVVHATPHGGGWMVGCALAARLSPDDLRHWLEDPAVGAPPAAGRTDQRHAG